MREKIKAMNGILLINKDVDWTSRDVVNKVSGILKTKKVGHVGSLDPFATGLVIVTVNSGTKIGPYLESLDKTYIAKLKLGKKTDTADRMGKVIKTSDISALTKEKIQDVLNSFLGESNQIPPMYSAISINGEKLYNLARKGEIVDRAPRQIHVYSIQLLSFTDDEIVFVTNVSKGTYIRTLGEDIADKIGTCGYLDDLIRTKIGSFNVANAIKVNEVNESKIIDISSALPHFKHISVNKEDEKRVRNGAAMNFNESDNLLLIVSAVFNTPLAIYEKKSDGLYHSKRGLF